MYELPCEFPNNFKLRILGKHAMAAPNSPTGSSNHTREKELQHPSKEHGKTLHGSYNTIEGDDSFSSLDLLQIMTKHIWSK